MPSYIKLYQHENTNPASYDRIFPENYESIPTSPIDIHFPSYAQLHPLSLSEKQSIFARCTQFDILDNVREDLNILDEKHSSKIRNSFHLFGIWPRSRHASFKHLEIGSGWILMEFDSASKQNIEFSSYLIKEEGNKRNINNFFTAPQSRKEPQSNFTSINDEDLNTNGTHNQYSENNVNRSSSENHIAQVYPLAYSNSLFFWVYFPSPGLWKWTILFRQNENEAFVPCFEYHITVRRPWNYDLGGFTPILFDTTCIHCDERVQLIQPLQYYLKENTVVRFELWLNIKQYTNVGILLRRRKCKNRIMFLEPQKNQKSSNPDISRRPKIQLTSKKQSTVSSPTSQFRKMKAMQSSNVDMQLFSGEVLLHFPEGTSADTTSVTILIFEKNDTSLENSFIVTSYVVKPYIEFVNTDWDQSTSDFIDIQNFSSRFSTENSVEEHEDIRHTSLPKPIGKAQELRPKNNYTKSSVYENISRFWTPDIHLFLPKTRYLRAGERTKFKLRLSNTSAVFVKNGKCRYDVQKTLSHFQGTYGEESSRMELFESTIILKDPEKKPKGDVVYLYYIPNGKGKTQKITIAEFVLLPSLKSNSMEVSRIQEYSTSESETDIPTPDHRALQSLPNRASRSKRIQNKLPNLRLEATFLNRPQMVYSVDFTKPLPKFLPSHMKNLSLFRFQNQVDLETYQNATQSKKHQVQLELEEYWKELKKSQKQSLPSNTVLYGKVSDANLPTSLEDTKNELAKILLKNNTVDEIVQRKGKLPKSLESYPKELSTLLARRYHTIDSIRNHDLGVPIHSKSPPILLANSVFQSSAASSSKSNFTEQENTLYGMLPRTRSPTRSQSGSPKRFQRPGLLSSSYRGGKEKSSIDEVIERMNQILPHENIRKLTQNTVVQYTEEHGRRTQTPNPIQEFRKKEENYRKSRQEKKPPRKEEISIVHQKSISPRKNYEDLNFEYFDKNHFILTEDEKRAHGFEKKKTQSTSNYQSIQDEFLIDRFSTSDDVGEFGNDLKFMYDITDTNGIVTIKNEEDTSPQETDEHISPNRGISSSSNTETLLGTPISPSQKIDNELSKEDKVKLVKQRLMNEKDRMKEKRQQASLEKVEHAQLLRKQQRDDERSTSHLFCNSGIKKYQVPRDLSFLSQRKFTFY